MNYVVSGPRSVVCFKGKMENGGMENGKITLLFLGLHRGSLLKGRINLILVLF